MASSFFVIALFGPSSVVDFLVSDSAAVNFLVCWSSPDFYELSLAASTAALLTLSISEAISTVETERCPR